MAGLYDELLIAAHAVWTRRWLALGVGWGIALIGWLIVSLIPNSYESEARVLIAARSLLPQNGAAGAPDDRRTLDSVRQTLTSGVNLEQVVRNTGLARQVANDRDVAERAAALADDIEVVAQQDNLFQITVSSGDRSLSDAENAVLAREIAGKLIDVFVAGDLAGNRAESGQSLRFLDAQLAARGRQLAEADARRNDFESRYLSALPGTGTIDDRLAAARAEIARIDSELVSARGALAAVNGQLAATPANTSTPGTMMPGGDSRAAQIQGQIAEGQARGWTDRHPDMVALRAQLSRTPAGGGPRMSGGSSSPNPMYASLRAMAAEKASVAGALSGRRAQLQSAIDGWAAAQTSEPEVAGQMTRLDRSYSVLKAQYDKLLADREEIALRDEARAESDAIKFNVIDPPSAPRVPATPNRPLLLTLVLLVAIAGGAGAAFAVGQLRGGYPNASRLARASGLPVIGSIGEVVTPGQRPERTRKLQLFAGGAAALAGLYALLLVVEFVSRAMVA